MTEETEGLSAAALAVLGEINGAIEHFINHGEGKTIFLNKMALSQDEQGMIRDFLGQGSVKITLDNTAEPAEWQESGVSGVWFGVFLNQSGKPLLETIEIGAFPLVAGAQAEDMMHDGQLLLERLT